MKIDQKPGCQFIMDFAKKLLENGIEIGENEYSEIVRFIRENRLLNDETLK